VQPFFHGVGGEKMKGISRASVRECVDKLIGNVRLFIMNNDY
jgi:hypothetical protein